MHKCTGIKVFEFCKIVFSIFIINKKDEPSTAHISICALQCYNFVKLTYGVTGKNCVDYLLTISLGVPTRAKATHNSSKQLSDVWQSKDLLDNNCK